jgi:hypothetical protein
MPSKRTPLHRQRKGGLTGEMISLFKRGCELQAGGHDDSDDESPEHDEFKQIDKRLNWTLLKLPPHAVGVFDRDLDGPMPGYMGGLASGRDWHLSVGLRKALLEAIGA